MQKYNILVTGSSGTIGSDLVQVLQANGHIVVGLDRMSPIFTSPDKFLMHDLRLPVYDKFEFDFVIHLAANARVADLIKNSNLALDNAITTFNVLEFVRKNPAKLIFASSREIYGNGQVLPVNEKAGSQRTIESPYSASKLFGESLVYAYRTSYNIDAKIVRFSNVYGRYDYSDRFIPKLINLMQENEPVEIWGEDKVLDFTYISDTTSGIKHLIDNWSKAKDVEYNIASGKKYKLINVAEKLKLLLNSKSEINILSSITGEVVSFQADISRMQILGWESIVDIDNGLEKTISWYNNNPSVTKI